jgi:integrase
VRRQTTPSPGGLVDKGTKGKRARKVPTTEEARELVGRRPDALGDNPAGRLLTGPRGGRITTKVLRGTTHWDEVVTALGYEHLHRHDLRGGRSVTTALRQQTCSGVTSWFLRQPGPFGAGRYVATCC